MHTYKLKTLALAAGSMALVTGFSGAASTLVDLGNTAPTGNIIDSEATRNSWTRAFDIDANANHARGMVFSTGDNATGSQFAITSITVSKDVAQTFVGGQLTLFVYEGTVADWTTGNGDTAQTAADIYDGTSVTPLLEETFALDGTFSALTYMQFSLDSSLLVNENSEFGFFMIYEQGTDANTYLQLDERSAGGGQIRLTDVANEVNDTRGLTFYVQGTTVVPEPSSTALLGLGGLALMIRRRK